MHRQTERALLALAVLMGAALACTALPGATQQPVGPTETPAEAPQAPTAGVPAGPAVESLRIPEVASVETQIIYEQQQRAALGGQNTMFWPDGNIGFVPVGDQYRFFAANGPVTARTLGTFDDPGAVVENSAQRIQGVSGDWAYLAGGPVYRDPDTGMLLLFYHAEMHFDPSGFPFHAFLGLAASHDEGVTFQDLGIILSTNAEPDASAPCCADMGGATFTIRDGTFYLYFRDRMQEGQDIQLALATAPVDEVVQAALNGTTSEWFKNNNGQQEPGLGGRSSPLEIGNPQSNWFSVSYNTALDAFVMAIAKHGALLDEPAEVTLIASTDGVEWSPRVPLQNCECQLTYPTIIDPNGNPFETGDTFYVYYVSNDPTAQLRWQNSALNRLTVTLSGQMVELPHEWEFDTDAEGWVVDNQIPSLEVSDGALVIEPTGNDPYMHSPSLGLSSTEYTTIEVRMRTDASGTGQFFFTSTDAPGISEASSVRFPINGSGQFETYTVDMSGAQGWSGNIGTLRFDPTDQQARVDIDYIRLLP